MPSRVVRTLASTRGLVDFPLLLRLETDAGTIGAAALVRAAEGGSGGPGCRDELRDGQARGKDLCLERGNLGVADECVIDCGDGVLPEQNFLWNEWAEIADDGAHVAVGELEPGACERVGKLVGMGLEALRDLVVCGVEAQGEVGGEHHRRVLPARDMGVGNEACTRTVFRVPLPGTTGTLGDFPIVTEKVIEIFVVPGDGPGGPGTFEAAGDGVFGIALTGGVLPAEALLLDRSAFRFRADIFAGIVCTVALAEGVAAGNEGEGLFVIHGHAAEGFADVAGGGERVGTAVGTFRVDVDEAHLDSGERVVEITLALVAVTAEPGVFGTPEDVFLRDPDVGAATAEAEGLEAHGVEGDIAGEDHEIGPGDFFAVLLLDGPEQAAGLVEADVVRPAVKGCKTLGAHACAAAAIGDAVGTGAVPGHADEEWAVVAVIGGPPGLRISHEGVEVLDDGIEVEGLEFFGVVEGGSERVGKSGVLVEDGEVEAVGPPFGIGQDLARVVGDRAVFRRGGFGSGDGVAVVGHRAFHCVG